MFQELFIQKLALDALKGRRNHKHLEYNDLARAVEENENMYFLRGELLFIFYYVINFKCLCLGKNIKYILG